MTHNTYQPSACRSIIPAGLLLLLALAGCGHTKHESQAVPHADIVVTDTVFLTYSRQDVVPNCLSYNAHSKLFVSQPYPDHISDKLYIHNRQGVVIDSTAHNLGFYYQNHINSLIYKHYLITLTKKHLLKYDLRTGQLTSRPLTQKILILGGKLIPVMKAYHNKLYVCTYSIDDMQYEVGSELCLRKARFLKVFDLDSLKLIRAVHIPARLFSGLYQPTFYEPLLAIDSLHNQLEILFTRLPKLVTYNLNNLDEYKILDLNLKDVILPAALPFSAKHQLHDNFYADHKLGAFIFLDNINGKTILGYTTGSAGQAANGSTRLYVILANDGQALLNFTLNNKSPQAYVWGFTSQKKFLAIANIRLFAAELPGYPLFFSKITTDNTH